MNLIFKHIIFGLLTFGLIGCNSNEKKSQSGESITYPDIKIIGAMRNVMWKGELSGKIDLDTIANKTGLYGIGPESHLIGELLINNGISYVSKVNSDSTMNVINTYKVSAPFFVYGNVTEWKEFELPSNIKTIKHLEQFIFDLTASFKKPFVFKLIGRTSKAIIHIQNLPENTKVTSPKEAHQGQTNYELTNEEVEIVGFFSTEHKGVFTHHDTFLHMHLITKDESKMGHLDELEIEKMKLYLPKK